MAFAKTFTLNFSDLPKALLLFVGSISQRRTVYPPPAPIFSVDRLTAQGKDRPALPSGRKFVREERKAY